MKSVVVAFVVVGLALVYSVPLSLDLKQVDAATEINNGVMQVAPPANAMKVAEQNVPLGGSTDPNLPSEHYPVSEGAKYAFKESSEVVAGIPIIDKQNKSAHGVLSDPIQFDRPEDRHPMEEKTPLDHVFPCDPSLVVDVDIPAAVSEQGKAHPMLPKWYGCSDEYETSREKASPEVRWSNIASDAVEFSLEMVSMGDESCPGTGPDAGKILWHIVGMNKVSSSMVLKAGASHDSRMLLGGKEEPNQWLEEYYSGPCPPPGVTECYRVKILVHRSNGWCQCGHKDVLFARNDKVEFQPFWYNGTFYDKPDTAPKV